MRRFRLSFRRKLLLLFVVFSIVPLAAAGFVVSQTVSRFYTAAVEESFSQAVFVREELMRQYLASIERLARSISTQEFVTTEQSDSEENNEGQNRLYVALTALKRENPFLDTVSVVGEDGLVIASTAADQEGALNFGTPYFSQVSSTRRPYIGSVVTSVYGKRVIPIATPLMQKGDNRITGILLIELNASALSSEFSPERFVLPHQNIALYAVDANGYVVLKGNTLSFQDQVWTLPVRKCQREHESITGRWQGANGSEVFGVSRCADFGDLRLTIVAEESVATAFAVSQNARFSVLWIAVVASILLSIAIVWVVGSMARPILALRTAARELGKGNFNATVSIDTHDELADLADDFDRARLKLKTLREQETRLAEMKTEFISIAAHQLRTPLTGIKWFLEGILSEIAQIAPTHLADLKRSVRSTNELITLVNDLLNVSRIEDGRLELHPHQGDIHAFVSDIAETVHQRHKDKKITVVITPPTEPLPAIMFDREQLSIAITNIIDNAIKYTPEGGNVTISFMEGPGSVVIVVSDTGIGIPKKEVSSLFSKFFRAHNAVRSHVSGSGLGLFAAQQIIKAHQGGITVDSEEGKGTIMRIRLPRT